MSRASEARVARVHLLVSIALLAGGVGWLVLRGLTYAAILQATGLIVLGAFTVLIFGTSRMLMAGITATTLPGPRWVAWLVLALATAGSLGVFISLAWGGARTWAALAATGWGIAMVLHAGVFVSVHLRARKEHGSLEPGERGPWGPLMVAGGVVYGVVGAVVLPLALIGRLPVPAVLHLLLPGFVTLFILGVATRVLLGVDRSGVPVVLLWAMVAGGLLGPGLVAWGLAGQARALVLGASLETVAVLIFAVGAGIRLATLGQRRPSLLAYAAAVAFLLAGVAMGVQFALDPASRVHVPVHATLNLLGFVGLVIVGASADLYAPAIQPGLSQLRGHTSLVTALGAFGVVVAAMGAASGHAVLARGGLTAYLVGMLVHLAGAWAANRRASGIVRVAHG